MARRPLGLLLDRRTGVAGGVDRWTTVGGSSFLAGTQSSVNPQLWQYCASSALSTEQLRHVFIGPRSTTTIRTAGRSGRGASSGT